MASRILTYVVMFLVPIINVRALTVDHYGYYRQFHLMVETLTPLLILGFPLSLQYYLPRTHNKEEKSVYVTQTLVFLFLSSLAAIVIYNVMAGVLGGGMGLMVRSFYWRICAYTGLTIMAFYMEWLFAAEQEFKRQAIYHAVFNTAQAVMVMTLAWVYKDVSAMIWGLTVFAFIRFLFAVFYTFGRYRPSLRLFSFATMREQLSFALPIGLFGIMLILVNQTDKFIINRFMGRTAFAVYAVGAFQLPFVNMISASVRNVTFPLMSQHHKKGELSAVADIWRRATVKRGLLYFPIFVFFEAVAHGVIKLFFTEDYVGATPIFRIYLALLPQVATDSVAVIQVFKNTRYLIRTFSLAFVANLVLSLLLYQLIGREGVPLGTVITMYSVNALNMTFSAGRCEVTLKQFLPLRALLTRFVAAIVPGIPLLWYTLTHDIDDVFVLTLLGLAYFLTYFLVCRITGLVTIHELRAFFRRG